MAKKKTSKQAHRLRIIAGKWRGQKINIIAQDGLRPTTNRVRETLFNWLALPIVNADCLDAFAGSAGLTFEALSRGAKSLVCVEKSLAAGRAIKHNAAYLKADNLELIEQDICSYLRVSRQSFDIVFLDPPFSQAQLLIAVLEIIIQRQIMKKNGLIYIEMAKHDRHLLDSLKLDLVWLKEKTAGQVCYALLSLSQ